MCVTRRQRRGEQKGRSRRSLARRPCSRGALVKKALLDVCDCLWAPQTPPHKQPCQSCFQPAAHSPLSLCSCSRGPGKRSKYVSDDSHTFCAHTDTHARTLNNCVLIVTDGPEGGGQTQRERWKNESGAGFLLLSKVRHVST